MERLDERTPVHTVDTQQARQRLVALLAELDRSVATLTPDSTDDDRQGTPGDADAGLDLADNARANALVEVATEQRNQVQQAIKRIDDGVYGRCVKCGAALPAERLEAKPEAARCMACQAASETAAR
jgi:RNA polymerase-binding transcription factor